MPIFPDLNSDAIFLYRTDIDEPLSCYAKLGFELDGTHWPSIEHYYQAMKFDDPKQREKIRQATHPKAARRLGRTRLKRIRKDWKKIREVVMTRAVYTTCRTHESVADKLLQTGDRKIIERSLYDYFWGCGRDGRGHNTYGKVLMNVRRKLSEERNEQATT